MYLCSYCECFWGFCCFFHVIVFSFLFFGGVKTSPIIFLNFEFFTFVFLGHDFKKKTLIPLSTVVYDISITQALSATFYMDNTDISEPFYVLF